MSAFIVNNSHITALAVYAARNGIGGHTDAKAIGDLLHAENVKSVNYRYGESARPIFELCERAAFHEFSRAQIVKAADCLDYQSCEHPGWEGSEAYKIVHAIIAGSSHDMPGYDDADWEISPPPVLSKPLPSVADILADPRQFLSPEQVQAIGNRHDNDNGMGM